MSKDKNKLYLAIAGILVLLAAWGIIGSFAGNQSGNGRNKRVKSDLALNDPNNTNISTTDTSNATLFQDLGKVDAQISKLNSDNASLVQSQNASANILAGVDRVETLTSMIAIIETKLKTKILEVGDSGGGSSKSLSDINGIGAKVIDAKAQAVSASGLVSSSTSSTNAMLKTAQADLKLATQDIQATRVDLGTIVAALTVSR